MILMGRQRYLLIWVLRGIWQRQTLALFDVRVIDTDAKSYVSHTFESVLSQAENDKKKKYVDASE